jgi:Zn-dependent metalloprotease
METLRGKCMKALKMTLSIQLIISAIFIITSAALADGYISQRANAHDSLSKYIDFVSKTIIGRYGSKFKLDNNGIPTSITGNLSSGLTAKDPVDIVYEFFEKNKDIFQLQNPRQELILIDSISDGIVGPTVRMAWAVNGVKVGCPEFRAQFSKASGLYEIDGDICPDARKINTNPIIGEEQAKQFVVNDTKNLGSKLGDVKSSQLIIAKFNDSFKLAWIINIVRMDSLIINTDYYIDATNGDILAKKSKIRY